jgi:serine/threonine protein kinase
MADPERRQRFVQEARAASSLNHPHIVTIHDIDEADGAHFIAMEHVEGRTLADRIGRRGLPLREALLLGSQIADALAQAHARGIVHRDLKPTKRDGDSGWCRQGARLRPRQAR